VLDFNGLALYRALLAFLTSSESAMYSGKAPNMHASKTNLLL
jgi:hypothetical protein